ncbi:enoyl-CoA hydratase/isomerase family protein [Sandarakinorhabdus limnophila]|uniref:enoyl-CoA hydratase/isomerase family protein n=1 Tax=Sandarakinorhabdus limnophila TaxID=210512 RepID=UPI0026ED1FDA|nr:enoyl-CoA hydratase/isomerase family protein [Sandarakinorhabdus limnophila]MCM0031740.1 enoyl-CoA hydratase/isomerase family protein [Sandarakinorhabdus limnophila]
MAYDGYTLIDVQRDGPLVTATVNNPPINLITMALFGELARLAEELEADPAALVFVLKSADPDFFLAHFDVAALIAMADAPAPPTDDANAYHAMCHRFRTMNKVTIAQIEGRVGGGGAELSMNFDMRFGVIGKTVINQMEVPIGILPGGTGTQNLPRLVGRARAMEIILGGIDVDAETAERWGWLNRALPANAIDAHVDALARRIASFPADAVRLAKQSVNSATLPMAEGCQQEADLFQTLLFSNPARHAMRRFLELGGQTRDGELRVAEISGAVAQG